MTEKTTREPTRRDAKETPFAQALTKLLSNVEPYSECRENDLKLDRRKHAARGSDNGVVGGELFTSL